MYRVPSWSVSILSNCSHTEVYNTAQVNVINFYIYNTSASQYILKTHIYIIILNVVYKVNTQISVMERVLNGADDSKEPYALNWVWKPEHFTRIKNGSVEHSNLTANELLDQKLVTNDTSDYLWYMTRWYMLHFPPLFFQIVFFTAFYHLTKMLNRFLSSHKNVAEFVILYWNLCVFSLEHISTDPICGNKEIALRVNTNGHILHAFVYGKHMGNLHVVCHYHFPCYISFS